MFRLLARLLPAFAVPAAILTFSIAPVPATAQGVSGPYLAAEHAARNGDILEAARYFSEAVSKDAKNPALLERSVLHQVAAGRIGTAVALARSLHEVDGDHHLGILVLAADALRRGDAKAARDLLSETGEDEPGFAGRLISAWARVGVGEGDQARADLESMRKDGVGGAAGEIFATYHLGLLAVAAGDDAAAVKAFEEARELAGTPTVRLARFHASALARLGRFDEAKVVVDERLSTLLGDGRLERLAADLEAGKAPDGAVKTGAEGAAEALFGISGLLSRGPSSIVGIAYARLATWIDPELIEARLLIAEMLSESEQYALAIDAFAEIPADAPEALEAMIGRAQAMEASEKLDDALALLGEVRTRFPDAIEAHTSLADMLRRDERFAEAADAYDGALKLVMTDERRFWPLYYQRGISYERSDQWDLAEVDFRKALELEPDQPLVLNYLGYSFVEMGRNLEEAEQMIEKAVEQRPEDGFIIDSLGWVQFRLGEFEGAVANLERAVELMPVDPILNDHFGDALWMVGRRTEARFQWKRALSFDPEEDDAERIRLKLDVGLDEVLADEAAQGKPTIITRDEEDEAGGKDDG